jgi:hypothetical protein
MAGYEATRAIVSANVYNTSATEESDGEVFGRCLDVLLVASDRGEAEASVCELEYLRVTINRQKFSCVDNLVLQYVQKESEIIREDRIKLIDIGNQQTTIFHRSFK